MHSYHLFASPISTVNLDDLVLGKAYVRCDGGGGWGVLLRLHRCGGDTVGRAYWRAGLGVRAVKRIGDGGCR